MMEITKGQVFVLRLFSAGQLALANVARCYHRGLAAANGSDNEDPN
jgi:hypothetical protein